jgi:hypothetical protein
MRRLICVFVLACSLCAIAQNHLPQIQGYVLDQEGAIVPHVTVTLKSARTGEIKMTTTDEQGVYRFGDLAAGAYVVHVVPPASSRYLEDEDRIVMANNETHLDFKLKMREPVISCAARSSPLGSDATADAMEICSRRLAGSRARDCGVVHVGDDPAGATKCAITSARKKAPFRVRYNLQGIDSDIAEGFVMTPAGKLFELRFDGDPGGGGGTNPERQRLSKHWCSRDRLYIDTRTGRARCNSVDSAP